MENECYAYIPKEQMRIFSVETNEILATEDLEEYFLFVSKEAPFNA